MILQVLTHTDITINGEMVTDSLHVQWSDVILSHDERQKFIEDILTIYEIIDQIILGLITLPSTIQTEIQITTIGVMVVIIIYGDDKMIVDEITGDQKLKQN